MFLGSYLDAHDANVLSNQPESDIWHEDVLGTSTLSGDLLHARSTLSGYGTVVLSSHNLNMCKCMVVNLAIYVSYDKRIVSNRTLFEISF